MLFVSVGILKAESYPIKVMIPEGTGTVKFKVESDEFAFDSSSWPQLAIDGTTTYPDAWGKSLTWTITQKEDDDIELSLPTGTDTTKDWGNLSIIVEGDVSALYVRDLNSQYDPAGVIKEAPMLSLIKKIQLTGGNSLSSLKLGKDATKTDYFENLETLSIPENQLSWFPVKTDKMTPSIGKVVTTGLSLGGKSNSFMLDASKLFASLYTQFADVKNTSLSIDRLYKDGKECADVSISHNGSIYSFVDANDIYIDGEYTADITISDETWNGITFGGVKLNIAKAEFTLTTHIDTEYSKEGNKVEIYKNDNSTPITDFENTVWVRGDIVTVKPVPNTDKGYVFDGQLTATGLDLKEDQFVEGNTFRYTVRGNVDPEITVGFKKADNIELAYSTADTNGELTIYHEDGQTSIQKGDKLTVGQKIRVVAIANDGFTVDEVTLNGTAIDAKEDTDENDNRFDAIIKVPVVGCNIVAYFKTIGKKFTLDVTNGPVTTVTGDNGETYFKNASGNATTYEKTIPAGTKLTFTMTLQPTSIGKRIVEKVVINGKTYTPEETEKGTFVIKDYPMPDAPVKATVYVKELTDITVTLNTVKGADGLSYNLIYNGEHQDVAYTLSPSDAPRDGIQLLYRKGKNDTYSTEMRFAEPNVSGETYWVKFVRPADNEYQAMGNGNEDEYAFTIGKAELTLGTLPTVSVVDKKYKVEGGKIKIGSKEFNALEYGTFSILDAGGGDITDKEVADDVTTATLRYSLNDRGKTLFILPAEGDFKVAIQDRKASTLTIKKYGDLKSSFIMKSGVSEIADGAEVLDGTNITFSLTPEVAATEVAGKNEYHIYQVDANGNIQDETTDYLKSGITYAVNATNPMTNPVYFMLVNEDGRDVLAIAESSELNQEVVYNEKVQEFDLSKVNWVTSEGTVIPDSKISGIIKTLKVTYELNSTAATPKDANKDGEAYDVYFYREASTSYQELPRTKVGTLKIKKADIDLDKYSIPKPVASQVRLGQSLFYSNLEGKATIAGHYAWNESQAAENIKVEANKSYKVKFVPDDSNYNDYIDIANVEVPVTTQPVVTYRVMPENWGTIRVVNADDPNLVYESGDEFIDGARLRIYIEPLNSDVEIENVVMCGHSFGNTDVLAYEVTDVDEVVEIVAYFKVKKEDPIVIPEGQYAVVFPDAVRGAKISYTGDPIVERDKDFKFTVTALAADVSKLVVKANGSTLTRAADGSYTIKKVQEKQNVTVSFSSTPTEVKVNIPLIYHEKGQPTSGRVQIINNTSNDGKYYYNDELTLIAYPETGVEFSSWSDKNKDSVRDIVLDKAEVSLQAVFTGTPVTGIEDIESAAIYTGRGFIMVKNVANAKVTVVSISGRLQAQEEVNGDTRIDVPQGIYVVVLESGSDAKRMKVIVK